MRLRIVACLAMAVAAAGCASPENPRIEPAADAALRRMSDALAKAQSFKLHSSATVEERMASGQMAQFSRDAVLVVSRPDRLHAEVRRSGRPFRLWHQGKELTILDVDRNVYAVIQTPQKIGDMLDELADKHGIIVPLDDLLYPNPYAGLTEKVTSGVLVDQQEVAGTLCDHLLFTQDNVDWQIWISSQAPCLPRRVVITDKTDAEQPQYEAMLDQWQLDLSPDASEFTPQLPAGAKRVEIAELLEPSEGDQK